MKPAGFSWTAGLLDDDVMINKAGFTISDELLREVESYINEHYVEEQKYKRRDLLDVERKTFSDADFISLTSQLPKVAEDAAFAPIRGSSTASSLENIIGKLDEPFSATLLRLIDATGKKDSEIYHRANIDRRLFSKIRSNEHYAPSKSTVLAFAVALELTLEQTEDLLERAGFALSHSRKFDVIVEYFIQRQRYDIFKINEVLFHYDQPLLGG